MAIATWLWEALLFILGGMCGFLLLQFLSRKKEAALEQQLKQSREMLAEYQKNVQQHFLTTATLVNQLTASYQAVYRHLVSGAKNLCTDDDAPQYNKLSDTTETTPD